MGKARDFKFGRYIHRVHRNKSPLKILEKRERGHIKGLPKFLVPLLPGISGSGKAIQTSNFLHKFRRSIGAKALEKFWEK